MADTWQLKAVLSANSAGMIKALTEAGKVAKNTRKYLLDVGKAAGNFTGKIGLPVSLLSGLAAGFSFSAIKSAVTGFADMGESVYRGALRAGMGVEEYQRMKYVAEQAGVGVESLENSVGKLNLNIGKAAAGKGKPVAELMQRLGIAVRDSNGQVRAGIDLLPQLADAFKRNENPAVRARMGMALFGKSWADMAPLLAEGSEGITASLERLSRLKGIINPTDIRGAKELGDKFKDLNMVTKGFQMTIAKELVPVMTPLIDDFVLWAAENKKLIAIQVKDFVRDLAEGLRSIDWRSVIDGARGVGRAIGGFVDMVGGAKNALLALVVVMNLQTIYAFVGLIGAAGRLIWYFGALAVTSIPATVTSLGTLAVALTTAGTAANALLLKLGAVGAAGAAGFAGWQVGGLLNDYVINPGVQKLSGNQDASLGTWIYDKMHPEENRPNLLGNSGKVKADGKIDININGLPPGARVDQKPAGDIPFNVNAGYSSNSMDLAW